MKISLIILFLFAGIVSVFSQEPDDINEQQLENLTELNDSETEDDIWIQQMSFFRKNPLNLNRADRDALQELRILTDFQIDNFLAYRKLIGKLISIYELQAIPVWDVETIKKLLPFVTVSNAVGVYENSGKRLKQGEHSFLFRASQVMEKSVGYRRESDKSRYLGSPQRFFARYKYQYKNLLQYGVTVDKDAGEQFFKGAQKQGFDFYSFHLFARKIGSIHALAIGDFTVNLGQGLIQWQSLAFKKSAEVMGIKRHSAILRPYNAAGEFNFHRGIGVTFRKRNLEATVFSSLKKVSANIVADSAGEAIYFTSFLTSGYHRTQNEVQDRKSLQQFAIGGNMSLNEEKFHVGINGILYHFSLPLQKQQQPYNLFAITGKQWHNISIDYSYTYKNLHFFGEAATDRNFHLALVNGLLISADAKVDVSFFHRFINKKYQSLNANAFTENTYPSNETGLYAGISIRPTSSIRINAYADIYQFPWLRYTADAPSYGKDFLFQLTYTPDKQTEIYSRFRSESKQNNTSGNSAATDYLILIPRKSWRTQISYHINKAVTVRQRIELLWWNKEESTEDGFLAFADCIYNASFSKLSGAVRLQYFESDSYNSRIYSYENDLLYSYSIPAFYYLGWRYYLNMKYRIGESIHCWLKWSQSAYPGRKSIGTGLDEIKGNKKSDIRLQFIIYF